MRIRKKNFKIHIFGKDLMYKSRMTEEKTIEVLTFISKIIAKRWLKASLKKLKLVAAKEE